MKRLICFLLVLILFASLLTSCKNYKNYKVEYPDIYTPEYCYENYIQACENLTHVYDAKNGIGEATYHPIKRFKVRYYAIADVPLDEYLVCHEIIPMSVHPFSIVKNKNKDLPQNEILSYEIADIKLYLCDLNERFTSRNYGFECVVKYMASLDEEKISSFQPYLQNCIDNKDYADDEEAFTGVWQNTYLLVIRIYFSKYDFLVWDSEILWKDNRYYMPLNFLNEESEWETLYIPLSQDIIDLIPPSVTFR